MTTTTDNDLALKLYRSWVVMKIRLSANREDLDRRFDSIMSEIDSEQEPPLFSTAKRLVGAACRHGVHAGWRFVQSQLVKVGALGAGAAAVGGYMTLRIEGALNFMVVPLAGIAIAMGGTVLMEPRRRGRAAKRDSVPSTAAK
ncbi:hypothetical protein [Streptomyces sp. NPDC002889]|uniref:hypothetical protein n=1 Tax=Streptomyces sp. NPDC002889 TaxID=3364669 RepID=UPI0036BECCB9